MYNLLTLNQIEMKLKGRNSSFRSMCAAMMLAIATAFVPFNIKAQSLVLDFENQPKKGGENAG